MIFRKIKKFIIKRFKIYREVFLDLKLVCFKVIKCKKSNKFLNWKINVISLIMIAMNFTFKILIKFKRFPS